MSDKMSRIRVIKDPVRYDYMVTGISDIGRCLTRAIFELEMCETYGRQELKAAPKITPEPPKDDGPRQMELF